MTSPIINHETLKTIREMTAASMIDCRKALSETDNNLNQAIDLLKQWGSVKTQQVSSSKQINGAVIARIDHEFNTGAIAEINCQSPEIARTPSFHTFCSDFVEYLISCRSGDMSAVKAIDEKRHALIAANNELITTLRNRVLEYLGDEKMLLTAYNHPGNQLAVLLAIEISDIAKRNDASIAELGMDIAMQIAAMRPIVISASQLPQEVIDKQIAIFKAQMADDKAACSKPDGIKEKMLQGRMAKFFNEVSLLGQPFVKENSKSINAIISDVEGKTGSTITVRDFVRYEVGGT